MGPWSLAFLLPTTALGPGLASPFPLLKASSLPLSQTLLESVSADSVRGLRGMGVGGQKCAELCGSSLSHSSLQYWLCRKVELLCGHQAALRLLGTRDKFKLESHSWEATPS